MASLDIEQEIEIFTIYYNKNRQLFEKAKDAVISHINKSIQRSEVGELTKIEGRVKDCEECIKKFQRKYQTDLEALEEPYEIRNYLSDLIGIRIICLYNDQIDLVTKILQKRFRIIDITDKISAIESTEDSFGYKGLHIDFTLKSDITEIPKFAPYTDLRFEVQIRSLIQDAWSVLDHKIKYKKSIPHDLKRRINVLSALFELADREFMEIRNATTELIQQATEGATEELFVDTGATTDGKLNDAGEKPINAFNFLRVAGHFYRDYEFKDYKVDGFVQDILSLYPNFQKSDLHKSINENLKQVREYFENINNNHPGLQFSPYTSIRHCLYLNNKKRFNRILSNVARQRFESWLKQEEKVIIEL